MILIWKCSCLNCGKDNIKVTACKIILPQAFIPFQKDILTRDSLQGICKRRIYKPVKHL